MADLWRQPQIRLGFRRVLVLGPSRGGSVSLRVGEPLRGVRERGGRETNEWKSGRGHARAHYAIPLRGGGRGAAERRINGSPIVGARATLCNWTQLGLCVRNLILSKDE